MYLSQTIKELRARDGLSQEALAERIYVSRQTISNWETERSYPDVQSLLLLSVLFDISLDELVKGDVPMMKNELDIHRVNVWSWVMLISFSLGVLMLFPMLSAFGVVGVIPTLILIVVGLASSIFIERLKKENSIETYSEIVAFMESREADSEKVAEEKQKSAGSTALKVFGSMAVGVALLATSLLLNWLIFG